MVRDSREAEREVEGGHRERGGSSASLCRREGDDGGPSRDLRRPKTWPPGSLGPPDSFFFLISFILEFSSRNCGVFVKVCFSLHLRARALARVH